MEEPNNKPKIEVDNNEIVNKINSFVKKQILEGDGPVHIAGFGDHGHLNYEDDKHIGHYFHAVPEGIIVVVYKKNTGGGIDDKTGENILVSLNKEEKEKFAEQLKSFINKVDWSDDSTGLEKEGLEKTIQILSQ